MKCTWMMSLCFFLFAGSAFAQNFGPFEVTVGSRQKVVLPMEIESVRSNRPGLLKVKQLGASRFGVEGLRAGKATLVIRTAAGNRAEVDVEVLAKYAPVMTASR